MPPALYPTLREVFLKRVIRIEAVQCERAAAMEESRQPGAPASTEDVELFFDHGIFPGVSARPRNSLWPIGTAEPELPAKLTALGRAIVAAGSAWRPLVRELRNGALTATGERFDRRQEPWRDADRKEIGSETWLNINGDLWFDVGAKTVCRMMDVGFGSRPVPVWFEIRVRGADEAAEFEDDQPAKEEAPTTGKRKQSALNESKPPAGEPAAATADQLDAPRRELSERDKSGDKALAPPQPDKKLTKKKIRVLEAMKELIKEKPGAAGLSDEVMSERLASRMRERVSAKIVAAARKHLRTSETSD